MKDITAIALAGSIVGGPVVADGKQNSQEDYRWPAAAQSAAPAELPSVGETVTPLPPPYATPARQLMIFTPVPRTRYFEPTELLVQLVAISPSS